MTPRGIESPNFSTGRYSKIIPKRLLKRYEEAYNDNDLLSLREEIILLDARLSDVLRRVDQGEGFSLWKDTRRLLSEYKAALRKKDVEQATLLMRRLEKLIDRGVGDYAAWHDVRVLIKERKQLVESERRRLIELQQTITSEQAMAFVAAVVSSVQRNVADPEIKELISRDIARLIGARPLPPGQVIDAEVVPIADDDDPAEYDE